MPGDDEDPVIDELVVGYNALAQSILTCRTLKVDSYELGYLDAWADAMHHASWAMEGKRVPADEAFELFGRVVKRDRPRHLRKQAQQLLDKYRRHN